MAGKLTLTTAQINDSATATNNFVLKADGAGGLKLSRGNDGATTQDVWSVDASGNFNANVAMQQGGIAMPRMVLATAQNTTSGTSIDFTGIPSWVKKITVSFVNVSTNGTSPLIIQVGSGSITTSGYGSTAIRVANTSTTGGGATTAGFAINGSGQTAADTHSGTMQITLVSGNTYAYSFTGAVSSTVAIFAGGQIALSGVIDRLRLTTVGGTDTFDGGSVNILYEG